jgi:transcriptional regulator with XRE-family HTH domain
MNIGRKIRWLRMHRGESQIELARRSGMTRQMLCRLERGRHNPTWRTVEKLLKRLGADIYIAVSR